MGDVLNVKALNCKDLGFYSFLFSYIYSNILTVPYTAAAKTRRFSEMQTLESYLFCVVMRYTYNCMLFSQIFISEEMAKGNLSAASQINRKLSPQY